jgi:hypothetical protein
VRRVVVADEMDVQVVGHRRVDRVDELPELDRSMPAMPLGRSHGRSGYRRPRRATWCRGASSRGCVARRARVASATAADCDPGPGSVPSHPRTRPRPYRAGSGTGRRCLGPCR